MTAGEKIRKRRIEAGVKQKDFAKLMGKTAAYVSAVELGKRGVKEKQLEKFAAVLECNTADLRDDVSRYTIDPHDDDFGAICNCAIRYVLGRKTYMPNLVMGFIRPRLSELTDKTLWCFQNDLQERARITRDFSDEWAGDEWKQFQQLVHEELVRRHNSND